MDSLPGRTLGGRYEIVELIGQGGTADTYRATDHALGRDVAIKALLKCNSDINTRLLCEARAMVRLNHPRIVAVYDAGEDSGCSYIVMELVRGKTLAATESGLSHEQALGYVGNVLEALEYANSQGVIHRDVRPSNIMIVEGGHQVKLTDFGLARRTSDMTQTTRTGQIVGTISYFAPERFLSKPVDVRSDLYSVGIVMYEIFTGTLPFRHDRDDVAATVYSHVHDLPIPPREINRDISEALERIILRAIDREPSARFQSAHEFLAEIGEVLGAHPALHAGDRSRETLAPGTVSTTPRKRGDAIENVLKGMIATRRRNYGEAHDAYLVAMDELSSIGNEIEYAKTALKFGAMVLQKSTDGRRDRTELREAVDRLNDSLTIFQERGLQEQFAHAEYTINALERTAIGVTF